MKSVVLRLLIYKEDSTNCYFFIYLLGWETLVGYLFAHNNGKQLNKGNSVGTLMEYITTSNLYWDGFRLDNLKIMPFEESEIERCQAIKGDLLVCEGGDVGRSCIWTYDYPIMLQNHIHKLRAYLPLCTKYFFYIFYLYNLIGVTTQQYSFLLFPLFVGIQMWFKSHREKICYLFINQLISYLFICSCQIFFVPLHL